MKKLWKTAALLLCLCIAGAALRPESIPGAAGIYEKTLRLHVIAHSDAPEDQALKLEVRDEILRTCRDLLAGADGRDEAEAVVRENLTVLQEQTESFLREKGSALSACLLLGEEYYPARRYENCSFPAGKYLSLRVYLGQGQGKNWWCVLYPPLCLDASAVSDGGYYDEEERALLLGKEGKYKVRFFILDLAQRLRSLFG